MKKIRLIFLCIFCLSFMILPLSMIYLTAKNYDLYNRLENTAATVEAEIVRTEYYDDTDSNDGYYVYISYSYNGEDYTDIYYRSYGIEPEVGEKVTVEIDPENPEILRPEESPLWLLFIAISLYCTFGLLWVSVISDKVTQLKKEKKWIELYGDLSINTNAVMADLEYEKECKVKYTYISASILSALTIVVGIHYYIQTNSYTAVIWCGITVAALWVCYLIGYIYKSKYHIYNDIKIVRDCFKKTDLESDSDGGYDKVWVFEKSGNWKPNSKNYVTLKKTNKTERKVDEKFIIVTKDMQIERVFNCEEFKMRGETE